jgi:hypothetical protein
MRPTSAFVCAVVLIGAGGCGSAGESTTPREVLSALNRGAFVDRADRICTQGRKRLILTGNRYFGDLPAGQDPSDAAVTEYAHREAIPILRHEYGRLRGLRPPQGDAATIDRILALAERGIGQLRSDPTVLNRGSGVPPALEQARDRAFRYGLGACGQPIERPNRPSALNR